MLVVKLLSMKALQVGLSKLRKQTKVMYFSYDKNKVRDKRNYSKYISYSESNDRYINWVEAIHISIISCSVMDRVMTGTAALLVSYEIMQCNEWA